MASPSEVKAEHIAKLGPELGEVFDALWREVSWLQTTWSEFRELFAVSHFRLEVLNKSAGFFFFVIQRELWHSALLTLRKLTDPPVSGNRKNLTIQRLPPLCSEPLRSEVGVLVERAVDDCHFARERANRQIAHFDFDTKLGRAASPIEEATRAKVETALVSVHKVMNKISCKLMNAQLMPTPIISDGAEALLSILADGIQLEEARRRYRGGSELPAELRQGDRL